jgi:hypothetical protein
MRMTVGEFILRWYAICPPKSIYLLLMCEIEFMPLHILAAECTDLNLINGEIDQ